jgi:hypothetical protein
MLSALRQAGFITPERIKAYSLMLLVGYLLGTLGWFATAHGLLDWQDRPLGTDFAQVWVAGGEVLSGHPDMPFDPVAHLERQRETFGSSTAVFTWGYPPYFLAVAAGLALLPYLAALLLWQGATLVLYLRASRAWLPDARAILPILAFPAVYVNFGHGQTGFLAAALLGGGLFLLERRPYLAGALFGLLAFKPQLGLMIPVALLAGGYWRAILGATAAVLVMTLASWFAFGTETFLAFFDSLAYSRINGLEYSNTGFFKMQSLFAAIRLIGGNVPLAYAAHMTLVVVISGGLAVLWHGRHDMRLKAAGLLVTSLLATPYGFDYDLVLLGPALAAMVSLGLEQGFRPFEKSLLLAAWAMPLVARTMAMTTLVPLGLFALLGFFLLIMGRSLSPDETTSQSPSVSTLC